METLNHLVDVLLTRFVWTSIQAALLIGAVYLLGRLLPRLSAAMRCMLWWLVGMQLLLGLLWSAPVRLPLLSPPSLSAPAGPGQQSTTYVATTAPAMMRDIAVPSLSPPNTSAPAISWHVAIATLWLTALLAQLILALRQWRQTRRILRESQPLHDPSLRALCVQQARVLGLRSCPQLRASETIVSPQVVGLWQPTVLLPASHALTAEEAAMAMAHELAHLRRGDLWLGWVPAIAQRLFFFHPLVVWAMREYALNREAACDAQVLQHDHTAPQDYGRLLLRLGVAHPMHCGLAGASPSFHNLKRRLTMLQQSVNHPQSRAHGWWLVVLIALIGVLPYRVTATSTTDAKVAQASDLPTAPPPPPPPPIPPPPPLMPPPPPPVPPVPPHEANDLSAHHVDIDVYTGAARGFALFDGDSVTISGSDKDYATAKRLRASNRTLLWFRRGNQAYVIHDANFIQQARQAYAPATDLAKSQGRLASEQGRLAGQEGGLAARSGALAGRQGELEGRRAAIEAERAALSVPPNAPQQTAAIDGKTQALQQQFSAIVREQAELDGQQHELSKQQAELSKQQAVLSTQQQEASTRANRQMDKLLDEALAKGIAQPMKN
ncbi:MAG: M56 family metallopeptidase [Lysobacterales bacterium]